MISDCDGHILEPPDLWEKYLGARCRSRAIRIRAGNDGYEYLKIEEFRKITQPVTARPEAPAHLTSPRALRSSTLYDQLAPLHRHQRGGAGCNDTSRNPPSPDTALPS